MKHKTTVINLYGGPGTGKTTIAAGLFYRMKKERFDVEFVSEYVKRWAWTNRQIGRYDQIYITAKQANLIYDLYGKVRYIITDSPILQGVVYDKYYNSGRSSVESLVLDHIKLAESDNVEFKHYMLPRTKDYVSKGRFESSTQARTLDKKIKNYLNSLHIKFKYFNSNLDDEEIIDEIIYRLSKKELHDKN